MKAAKYIVLIFLSFIAKTVCGSIGESSSTTGGWVEVKKIATSKLEITCNLLYEISGNSADVVTDPTHQLRIKSDTSVLLKVFDSAKNSITLYAPWVTGYYYTQKDTSKTYIEPNSSGYNKYYVIVFKCTLDLTSNLVLQNLSFKSNSFLDFTCDFTGNIHTSPGKYWNVNKLQNPTATTRVYVNQLAVNEKSLVFSHVGFSKLMDYNSKTYYAVNYMNHGIYGKYGDSIFIEFIKPEKSLLKPSDSVIFNKGYTTETPFYGYCTDSSNTCSASPSLTPARGNYLNSLTGDIAFTSVKDFQGSVYAIRVYQFKKNANGKWQNKGFSTLSHSMVTYSAYIPFDRISIGTIFPSFNLPPRLDLCEGDSIVSTVKTQNAYNAIKYLGNLDGNFPNTSLQTDYSTGNSTPTFKFKVVAKNGDYSSVPGVVTLRVHADSNWTYGEAARSAPVYVHKPLSPEIIVTANGCNNLKAIIKTVNTDVGVKPTWSVHRGSLSSPAIYTSTDNVLNFTGLQQDKYYVKCFVVPFQSTCKCTGKWAIDSLDMKKLWPNLDFTLNRNTVCLKDSTKVYFAKDVKGFKGSTLHYHWDADSMIALKDTFVRNFKGPVQMNLRIYDDSGCDYSKTFSLPVDPVHALDVTPQVLQCGRDTLTLAAYSKSTHSYWYGKYSVKDAANTVVETRLDSIFKYYFSQPQNTVQSEFYSDQGCYQSYQTTVTIDTTTIRISNANLVLCKQMKQFDLLNLQATPKGGNWSNNISGNNNIVRLDTFTAYPYRLPIQYEYQNTATQCHFAKEDTLLIWDTVRLMLKSVPALCYELKYWDAAKQYGLTTSSKGRWVAQKSPLKMDSMGMVEPRASRSKIHALYFVQTDNQGCIEWYKGEVEIAEPKLQLQAQSDVVIGYAPLKVSFTGSNTLLNSTQYFWDFGVKATTKDTATGGVAKYTYSDTGRYLVKFVGKVQGCWDTITLPIIQVGSLGTQAMKVESGLKIYPNPTKAGGEATLVYWKHASGIAGGAAGTAGSGSTTGLGNSETVTGAAGTASTQRSLENGEIQIFNAIGQRIAVYPTASSGKGEIQIALPQSGVYFITANWLLNAAIWVVE